MIKLKEMNMLVTGYNSLVSVKGYDIKKRDEMKSQIDIKLKELNIETKEEKLRAYLLLDMPIKQAIIDAKISVYGIKIDSEYNTISLIDKEIFIDLWAIEAYSEKNVMPNGQTKHWVSKLNSALYAHFMGKYNALELKSKRYNAADVDEMKTIFDVVDVDSKTSMTKIMKQVLDGVIYEPVELNIKGAKGKIEKEKKAMVNKYKLDGRDVSYLYDTYLTTSKKDTLGLVFPTDETVRVNIMRVFHRILTNGSYSVE